MDLNVTIPKAKQDLKAAQDKYKISEVKVTKIRNEVEAIKQKWQNLKVQLAGCNESAKLYEEEYLSLLVKIDFLRLKQHKLELSVSSNRLNIKKHEKKLEESASIHDTSLQRIGKDENNELKLQANGLKKENDELQSAIAENEIRMKQFLSKIKQLYATDV